MNTCHQIVMLIHDIIHRSTDGRQEWSVITLCDNCVGISNR